MGASLVNEDAYVLEDPLRPRNKRCRLTRRASKLYKVDHTITQEVAETHRALDRAKHARRRG